MQCVETIRTYSVVRDVRLDVHLAAGQRQIFLVFADVDLVLRINASAPLKPTPRSVLHTFHPTEQIYGLRSTSSIGQCVGNPISSSFPIASWFSLLSSAQMSGSPFITGMPFFETVYLILAAVNPSDVKQPLVDTSHFLLIEVVKFESIVTTLLSPQLAILLNRTFQPSCFWRQ